MRDFFKERKCYLIFAFALLLTVGCYFLPLDSLGSYNIYGEFKGIRPLMFAIICDAFLGIFVLSMAITERKIVGTILGAVTIFLFPILNQLNFIQMYMKLPI